MVIEMPQRAFQTRRAIFFFTGLSAFFLASRTRSAIVVLPKNTMMREWTGFQRSQREHAFAELHSGRPPAQAVKLFRPSTASIMSMSFSLFAGTFRQKPP